MEGTQRIFFYKYRLNFVSLTSQACGFINIIATSKDEAQRIFLKYCKLKDVKIIDIKLIGLIPLDEQPVATVQPLTLQVNGEDIGTYTGEEMTMNIFVPTKTSQILNDSGFIDSSSVADLESRVTEDVLNALGDDVLTKDMVMDEFTIDDIDKDDKIPSVGAVVKYIETCTVDASTIQQIIDGAVEPIDPTKHYVTDDVLENYAKTDDVSTALDTKSDKDTTYTQDQVNDLLGQKQDEINRANNDIYTLKGLVGDLGGNVVYECPDTVTGKSFTTLLGKNGTVKLTDDVESGRFGPGIMAKNNVKLNLNGHNLTFTGLTPSGSYAAIMTRGTQVLTISGSGTIDAGGGICIEANGVDSVINLNGSSTNYITNRPGAELIYCYAGTINISGGIFKNNGSPYLLNCYDANYASGKAKIIVTGGKFYDFNPADNTAEGEHTNFLAEGYHVETSTDGEHTVYTVKKD